MCLLLLRNVGGVCSKMSWEEDFSWNLRHGDCGGREHHSNITLAVAITDRKIMDIVVTNVGAVCTAVVVLMITAVVLTITAVVLTVTAVV